MPCVMVLELPVPIVLLEVGVSVPVTCAVVVELPVPIVVLEVADTVPVT